jgi:hypothetical protein
MYTPPRQVIQVNRNPHTIGLKSIFKLVNQQTPEGKAARMYFEQTRPSIQCKDVLTGLPRNTCWLCGLQIVGETPQCEHVLPFPQGPIFLEIYSRKYGTKITPELQLEYDYAHGFCNRIKSGRVFITGDENGYSPNVDEIVDCLQTLHTKYPQMNLETQYAHVMGRLFDICDVVNKNLEISPTKGHVFNVGRNLTMEFTKHLGDAEMKSGKRKRTLRKKRTKRRKTYKQKHLK